MATNVGLNHRLRKNASSQPAHVRGSCAEGRKGLQEEIVN